MTYRISSEEDLADELASRGVSPFTKVLDGEPAYVLCFIPVFFAAIFLIIHVAVFYDIYSVQLSRFTGNYAETEATVVSQSFQVLTHRHHSKHGASSTTRETRYHTKAVSDDGTEFNFKGTVNYGSKGCKLKIKYSQANPSHAYVDVSLADRFSDKLVGLIVLFFFGLAVWGVFSAFRWNRKCREIVERDLYLPVRQTPRYEVRIVQHRKSPYSHKEYAPVYRYAMPDGADLLFQGMWSRARHEGEPANDYKDFRVYMIEPENPKNNKYFIKSTPR